MEKLKEALIQFAHSNPSLFPNDSGNSYPVLIEQCFPQFFTDFQTPNHPPYAAMIYKAIWELNKKGGSSEKSISKYIKKEYADLPWAHSTLLKHHLQKLCDSKEICMNDKQRYLLAGAEPESVKKSSGPSKKRKKQKSRSEAEAGKKSGRSHKKYKKKKKDRLGVQNTGDKEQIGLHKRKMKQGLKCKMKVSKQNNEASVDESHEQKQTVEVKMGDIQIQEQSGLHKRKRKHGLKSKIKSSKRVKKHAINEDTKLQLLGEANLKQSNEVTGEELHEQNQIVEVNRGDTWIQEPDEAGLKKHVINEGTKLQLLGESNLKQNNEVTGDDSHEQDQIVEVNRGELRVQEQNEAGQESDHEEQIQTKKNPEILQPEGSPDSNLVLHGNGKRVWTRSQLKAVTNKNVLAACSGYANMPEDKPDIVEHLSNDEQHSTVDTELQQISRRPSLDKPLIEFLKPMSSTMVARVPDDEPTSGASSTVQDPIGSQQDQQPEKSLVEDKPKYKRRGRPRKLSGPEKDEGLCNSKPAAVSRKSRKSVKKGKVGNKKGLAKYKHHGRHKMTRRSSRNRS